MHIMGGVAHVGRFAVGRAGIGVRPGLYRTNLIDSLIRLRNRMSMFTGWFGYGRGRLSVMAVLALRKGGRRKTEHQDCEAGLNDSPHKAETADANASFIAPREKNTEVQHVTPQRAPAKWSEARARSK